MFPALPLKSFQAFSRLKEIPKIACVFWGQEEYTGNIRVNERTEYVTFVQSAAASLLYSKRGIGCNFFSDGYYPDIFTFSSQSSYSALIRAFDQTTTISIFSMSYIFGVPADGDTGGTGDSPNTGSYPGSSTLFCLLTLSISHDHPVQYHGYHHRTVPGQYDRGCSPGSSPSRAIWPSPDCQASSAYSDPRYSSSHVRHHTGRQF